MIKFTSFFPGYFIYIFLICLTTGIKAQDIEKHSFNDSFQSNTANKQVMSGNNFPLDLKTIPEDGYHPGIIRIKFEREFEKTLESIDFGITDNGYIKTTISTLDELNKSYTVSKYTPMLKELYKISEASLQYKERHREWGLHLWYELKLDDRADIIKAIIDFESLDKVKVAEPALIKKLIKPVDITPIKDGSMGQEWTPNDPLYANNQWHFNNTGQTIGGQAGLPGMDCNAEAAWNIETGNSDVIVAIIDTGMEFYHDDLEGNMWPDIGPQGTGTTPGSHGTHVGGTVAAVTNNSLGVAGLAGGSGADDGVSLMTINIFTGGISVYNAFVYAADNGAAITQNSWGYTTPGYFPPTTQQAIDYFNENGGGSALLNGGLTIFAAGNENSSQPIYPAAYEGTMAVASHDNQGNRSSFSCYGTWVDIIAPGTNVASTETGNTYSFKSGTSMACPHVSGAAALVISNDYGMLTNTELRDIIINSANDDIYNYNPNFIGMLGSGRLDAYAALTYTAYTITFNVMENSPAQDPIENATININGIQITTDQNGTATTNLADGTHNATISAQGYETKELTFIVDGEEKSIDIYMMDKIIEPFNLEVITEGMDPGEALFLWNVYDEYEFRYDDGVQHHRLGFQNGTANSIMGAAHHNEALLEKITWMLTDEEGPHNTVNIWVFGLDANGLPDSGNMLYNQNNVPNTDLEWNTYEFSSPVEAPNGFLIGLSYNGYLALATDNGTGPPWEYIPNTQFAVADYTSGGWNSICYWGFELNFLLRAYGENHGEITFELPANLKNPKTNNTETGEKYAGNLNELKTVLINNKQPYYPGQHNEQTAKSRAFIGWNVFLNSEKVAAEIEETEYLFSGLSAGEHTAGVQSVYTTGSSDIVEIDFEIIDGVYFEVTFYIEDEEGNEINDAVVTFNGIQNAPGDYVFENIKIGTYTYKVEKEGYITVEDQVYVDDDITIEVTMIAEAYTLTLVADPAEGGTVYGEGDYEEGEVVDISAVTNEGWMFIEWTGDIEHVADPGSAETTVTMPAEDISLTASFDEIPTYTLTLSADPEEGGNVYGEGEYEEGEEVIITANPNEGWFFVEWTGDIAHADNPNSTETTVTMPAEDISLTANFEEIPPELFTLALFADPEEGGNVHGEGHYEQGEELDISAKPNEGWLFIKWTGDTEHLADPDAAETTVTMPEEDIELTASFEEIPPTYTLTLDTNPENAGTVEGDGEYEEGEEVTITATPNEGWFFVDWTGDTEHVDNAHSATATVTMPAEDISLTANFDVEPPETYTLSLLADPPEGGNVDGAGEYQAGETVDIKAMPVDADWEFQNWTGDINYVDDPGSATAIVTMPEMDITLTANFMYISVEDIAKVELSVYPNPTRDKFYVESSEMIKQIRLIDISGQVVKEIAVDGLNTEINVNNLRAGVYFIQIYSGDSVITMRVQVTR